MSLATVLSRLLGYGRDMLAAGLFGATWISDAFVVAFRLPNLFRDLFAEGALSSALTPSLSRAQLKGPASAGELANKAFTAMLLLSGCLALLGAGIAPWILSWAAPGFKARPEQWALAVRLTRILFPFISVMSLAAVLMALLNSGRRFTLPALAPALMNVVMIAFGLLVCPAFHAEPVLEIQAWAWGAVAGGLAQLLIQWPGAVRAGFRWRPRWPFGDLELRKVLRQMLPAVLGQSTTQVNLLVNTLLATQLGAGAVTYLYYGNRLMQLPLGVFGVAIATAVLPELAQHHAKGETAHFRAVLSYGLRLTLFITLPAMAGLVALAEPINILLLNYGRFDLEAARATAKASICYTLGVVFASWVKVLVPAFYAIEQGAVAVRVSAAMVLLNLVLNLTLIHRLGYLGLAVSASLTAAVQALLLLWLLSKRVGRVFDAHVRTEAWKICGAVTAMLLCIAFAYAGLELSLGSGLFTGGQGRGKLAFATLGLIVLGSASYLSLSRAWGLQHLWPFGRRQSRGAAGEVAKAASGAYDGL